MTEPQMPATAALIEIGEQFINILLEQGLDTWAKVVEYLPALGNDDMFQSLWQMRVGQ